MDVNPKHVNRWLDFIGASEDKRRIYWESSMILEIGFSSGISYFCELSHYIFGSFSEGTTNSFYKNDIDMLFCDERFTVIDNIKYATGELCFLMTSDSSTKPGYVKLHQIVDGVTQNSLKHFVSDKFKSDDYGRVCLQYLPYFDNHEPSVRHGPAYTIPLESNGAEGIEGDMVFALRCKHVPYFSNSWICRPRQYDWPSQKQLKKMSSYGCFLVEVSHPYSHNKSIEWRISFSLQERELMKSLNPTQHKCYILLKMIKREIIEPCAGESISSYHCKTCLLYTIESSGSWLWTEENIIVCIRLCLLRLLVWSKNGNCPNYFIPEENMFDKVDRNTLQVLQTELEFLLCEGSGFLSRLAHFKKYRYMYGWMHKHSKLNCYPLIVNTTFLIYQLRNSILDKNCKNLDGLQALLQQLQLTDQVTEHTPTDVRLVVGYIIPHIHLQIAQGLASVKTITSDTFGLLPLNIINNIMLSIACDLISSRLSLAAIMIHVGVFKACWHILQEIEDSVTPHIISVCRCTKNQRNSQFENKVTTESLSIHDVIEQHEAGCMVYFRQHANIAHPGLQFEVYRSVYIDDGPRNDYIFWFDWIVVDSKVYLYFLQYICCIKANKRPAWRNSYVENMRHFIENDTNIGHRETAYNLLGWMLVQENKLQEAWQCLCRSWRIRPHHNAAKWHLFLLLNDLLR